jgi:2-dehydropantoate 2-reductase
LQVTEGEYSYIQRAPQTYTALEDVPDGEYDAAYLLMKADSVVHAARRTITLLKPEGYVVTFQNGIVEDAVGEAIDEERVISGIIGWGGTMHAPGVYERTTGGTIHIGELDGSISERLKLLAVACKTTGMSVIMTPNIRGALWSKLAINCTITTIGALTGDTLGELVKDARIRKVFLRTYSEVVDTAEALGITLERIATNPSLLYLPRGANFVQTFIKDVLVRLVGRRYGKQKSSSLQSLQRGRKTEIDYLNGYVVQQAQKVDVPTPVNAALVTMIKEIEGGQRQIARANVDDLAREIGL